MRLDHVQLAIPKGSEERCRAFYRDLLGWSELAKPPVLAARGGLWFEIEGGQVHLGVDENFRPARKAHPAFTVTELELVADRLRAAGAEVVFDDAISNVRRCYAFDPVGNRLEFIQA